MDLGLSTFTPKEVSVFHIFVNNLWRTKGFGCMWVPFILGLLTTCVWYFEWKGFNVNFRVFEVEEPLKFRVRNKN